jgi:branched-chain amino acid aminotransferase|tara:strand:- start:1576 stop:2622 length:1047 start_codon:yes stop_codon:yes gene_type:complete
VKIEINKKTKIDRIDFNNLDFGETFTDHMFVCDYSNGKWNTPEIIPYQSISLDPSASALHYGQAVFEGMKAYKDVNGKVWMFRPKENWLRLNKSCERMMIPGFPEDYFMKGLKKLISIDSEWVKPGDGNSLYLRPFIFASQPSVQASPSKEYKFMIICSPAKSYYSNSVFNVLIAEKYSRAADGGVGYAKAAGNYGAQFYPTSLAQEQGYQQVVWTDANEHKFIEEAGTMNIFVRIGDTLVTAPTNNRILDGITRKSAIQIAKDMGINVEIRSITIDEIIEALKNRMLKEIFGAGTAVVIIPITGFGYQNTDYKLQSIKDSYAIRLKKAITEIQYNISEDPYNWRIEV